MNMVENALLSSSVQKGVLWEWNDAIFAGRKDELAILREALRNCEEDRETGNSSKSLNQNQCFFIDGLSGIGKSALMNQAFLAQSHSAKSNGVSGEHTHNTPPPSNSKKKAIITHAGFEDSQATTPLMVWVEAAEGILFQLKDDKRFSVHLYKSFQSSGQQHADYLSILSSVLGHRLSESFSIRRTSGRISLSRYGIVSEEASSVLRSEAELAENEQNDMNAFDSNEKDYSFDALRLAYRQLFRIICEYTTVVLCLDDLQWGEVDDFKILKTLLTDSELRGKLIFVGAHRPLSMMHPLRFIKRSLTYRTLSLEPLGFDDIEHILCKIFPGDEPPDDLEELVGALQDRTSGHPFFLKMLLRYLEEDGTLRYDSRVKHSWEWDAAVIRDDSKSDVELVAEILMRTPANGTEQLAEEMQPSSFKDKVPPLAHIMSLAAFLGRRKISFHLLVWLLEEEADGLESKTKLQALLNQAVILGMMVRITPGVTRAQVNRALQSSTYYQFTHDKIRHGALLCLPDDDEKVQRLHLKVGLRLRSLHELEPNRDRYLFLTVTQLNEGSPQLKSQRELFKLAKLNYQSAAACLKRSAFYSAVHFLRYCLGHLGAERLVGDTADFAMQAELALARMEYCCGLLDRSLERSDMLLRHVQLDDDDKSSNRAAALHHLKVLCLIQQNQPRKALDLAMDVLNRMDVKYPKKFVKVQVMRKIGKARRLLEKQKDQELLKLAWARKRKHSLAAGFLPRIVDLCLTHGYEDHVTCCTLMGLELTIEKGRNPMTAQALCYWGLFLATEGHLDEALRFGRLALHMAHEGKGGLLDDRVPTLYYSWIHHWKDPYASALQPVSNALKKMWEMGLLESVVEDTPTFLRLFFLSGFRLETLLKEVRQYATLCNDFGMEYSRRLADPFAQMIVNMVEGPHELILRGEFMEESTTLRFFKERKSDIGVQLFCFYKMMLAYFFNEYDAAMKFSKNLTDMFPEGADVWVPYRFYLRGMVAWAMYGKTNKKKYRIQARMMTAKIEEWVNAGVVNCEHQLQVLKAERAAALDRDGSKRESVEAAYQKAIDICKSKGFRYDEAITNERAGYYFLKLRNAVMAADYLIAARDIYEDWQAHSKARQIQVKFRDLLGPYDIRQSVRESVTSHETPSLKRQLSMQSITEDE